MSDVANLLDTPKRTTLDLQSITLRTSLKEFERSFALDHGRKPTRDDIKAVDKIAEQYKTYNKIRDVLSGKLTYENFIAPVKTTPKKPSHRRTDSNLSWTPHRKTSHGTPVKQIHPHQLDPYDSPSSSSPRPILLSAIGPTPQRDGKVLGLFDMMSATKRSSGAESSEHRKRKLASILEESPQKATLGVAIQTPLKKRRCDEEDILRYLSGTSDATPATGRRNQSRTPVSEGRKFMLSQFFASPDSVGRTHSKAAQLNASRTPLRDNLLSVTPHKVFVHDPDHDATPAYLKRSISFRDRLMLATNLIGSGDTLKSPVLARSGPLSLRHFRVASKPLSQIVNDLRDIEDGDHDDDLDALREMEDSNIDVLLSRNPSLTSDKENAVEHTDQNRVWKKRGQKRTTKRAKIRPSTAKIAAAPKFVCAQDRHVDGSWSDEFPSDPDDTEQPPTSNAPGPSRFEPRSISYRDEDEDEAHSNSDLDFDESAKDRTRHDRRQRHNQTGKDTQKPKSSATASKKRSTINPNAQSHMNFRSLKIRNKNSKAKGAGRRFGKRR